MVRNSRLWVRKTEERKKKKEKREKKKEGGKKGGREKRAEKCNYIQLNRKKEDMND